MEEEQQVQQNKKSKKIYWIIPIITIIILGGSIYSYYQHEPINNENPFENNESFEKNVCLIIKATPSWVKKEGVVSEGYTNFGGTDPKGVVDLLIESQVYLVYHDDCPWCKNQVAYFGTNWEKYVESGYTINCKYVLQS